MNTPGSAHTPSPLHHAVETGNPPAVRELLEQGADVNATNRRGQTPLHLAAMRKDHEIAQLLLRHGALHKATDEERRTPLHYAVQHHSLRVAQLLLEHNAQPNPSGTPPPVSHVSEGETATTCFFRRHTRYPDMIDAKGHTPLSLAIEQDNSAMVRLLLAHGASTRYPCAKDQTALHDAVMSGNLHITQELLLRRKACVNETDSGGMTPLHLAARNGHVGMVDLLLKAGADAELPDRQGRTPLHSAAACRRIRVVSRLLEEKVNACTMDASNETPLHAAVREPSGAILRALLEYGARPDDAGDPEFTPLHLAARNGNLTAAQLLMEHRAYAPHTVRYGRPPLHLATAAGNIRMACLLLEREQGWRCIRTTDDEGKTPLQYAKEHGRKSMVKLLQDASVLGLQQALARQIPKETPPQLTYACLDCDRIDDLRTQLQQGADANGGKWHYPLLAATHNNNIEAVRLLLEHGADVNKSDKNGQTALIEAIMTQKNDIAELLLDYGADLNTPYYDYSLLFFTARETNIPALRFALEHGADVNLPLRGGASLLRWTAIYYHHEELFRLMLRHGAEDYDDTHVSYLSTAMTEWMREHSALDKGEDTPAEKHPEAPRPEADAGKEEQAPPQEAPARPGLMQRLAALWKNLFA